MSNVSPQELITLPAELNQRVQAELEPDERLIWVGQPIPKLLIWTDGSMSFFCFGLLWLAFCLMFSGVLVASLIKDTKPMEWEHLFAIPFMILFTGIGFFLLSIPYWNYRCSFRTIYLLTDRRAVIWKPRIFRGWDIFSIRPGDIGFGIRKEYYAYIFRREFLDGTGDVILQEFTSKEAKAHVEAEWTHQKLGFLAITNVKSVESLIRQTLLTVPSSNNSKV